MRPKHVATEGTQRIMLNGWLIAAAIQCYVNNLYVYRLGQVGVVAL